MTATGRGPLTADGCAVEVYLRLPALGEADVVHDVAGAGASVLDLGAGVGRIAHGLVALGHEVVAVDQSAEMLAHVRGASTVAAPIAGLDLGRSFDAAAEVTGRAGDVRIELRDITRDGDRLSATARYWVDDELWTQPFTVQRLDDDALRRELLDAGVSFERFAADDRTWFVATGDAGR